MFRSISIPILALFGLSPVHAGNDELLIRLQPEETSPIVARVVATEKVRLDAAPVKDRAKAEAGWQQLTLELPLEGYVPLTILSKNFEITEDSAVHYLPTSDSAIVTSIGPADSYRVLRAEEGWATVKVDKSITGYFIAAKPERGHQAIPATRRQNVEPAAGLALPQLAFDPKQEVGQISPSQLPPETVIWKSAPRTPSAQIREPQPQAVQLVPEAPILPDGIMVGPAETQAREIQPATPEPEKPLRLLTGILVREIGEDGPNYPIRLKSPEGSLIAYVDFSRVFISDLKPYIDQRVYLRGQVFPITPNDNQFVIYAKEIQLAN